jgi:hypothetical protein
MALTENLGVTRVVPMAYVENGPVKVDNNCWRQGSRRNHRLTRGCKGT